jgi:hypothetical protein
MHKIGTEKVLINFSITQFLECWENPILFSCSTNTLLAISLKKRLYDYIAESPREWKTTQVRFTCFLNQNLLFRNPEEIADSPLFRKLAYGVNVTANSLQTRTTTISCVDELKMWYKQHE